MHPLTSTDLLDLWEQALGAPPLRRPVVLAHAVAPHASADELLAAPLGSRDARLARLRGSLLGWGVEAMADCPGCGDTVETTFDLEELHPSSRGDRVAAAPAELLVALGGHDVGCRPPSTIDLELAGASDRPEEALLERCVVSAACDGAAVAAGSLPAEVRDAVEDALSQADPGADVLLRLACPACATEWSASFDIATFLWEEIDHLARRTLAEVDLLARVYGWREPDVLALTPWRRTCYLELAQQ